MPAWGSVGRMTFVKNAHARHPASSFAYHGGLGAPWQSRDSEDWRMKKQLLQRPAVGLTPAKPVFRKRRRLVLAAERQARRRKSTTWGPSRSDRSARAAALPLNIGASLIVVLLLSLGLWAAILGAVASSASAVLG